MFGLLFALLPILSVAAHTGTPLRLARQDVVDCTTPCTTLSDSVSAGGTDGLAAICTNTVASNYQACYSCEVKAGGLTAQAAQSTVDAYVNGCKTGGHPINGFTISADGSISGGGAASGAAPAASSASPAASGASPAASGAPASSPAKTGDAVRASAGILGAASAFVFVVLGTVV